MKSAVYVILCRKMQFYFGLYIVYRNLGLFKDENLRPVSRKGFQPWLWIAEECYPSSHRPRCFGQGANLSFSRPCPWSMASIATQVKQRSRAHVQFAVIEPGHRKLYEAPFLQQNTRVPPLKLAFEKIWELGCKTYYWPRQLMINVEVAAERAWTVVNPKKLILHIFTSFQTACLVSLVLYLGHRISWWVVPVAFWHPWPLGQTLRVEVVRAISVYPLSLAAWIILNPIANVCRNSVSADIVFDFSRSMYQSVEDLEASDIHNRQVYWSWTPFQSELCRDLISMFGQILILKTRYLISLYVIASLELFA